MSGIEPKRMPDERRKEIENFLTKALDGTAAPQYKSTYYHRDVYDLLAHILALEDEIASLLAAVKKYKGKWTRLNRLSQADETEKDKVIRLQHRTIGKLNERKKHLQAHVKAAVKQVEIERAEIAALKRELAAAREIIDRVPDLLDLVCCDGSAEQIVDTMAPIINEMYEKRAAIRAAHAALKSQRAGHDLRGKTP